MSTRQHFVPQSQSGTDKSYVSLERHVCPACGAVFDTGALLLDRRMLNSLEKYTVTGTSFCKDCQEKLDEGFVILVEAEEDKRTGKPRRTGEMAYLRREVSDRVFNVQPIETMAYLEIGVLEQLKNRIVTEGEQT